MIKKMTYKEKKKEEDEKVIDAVTNVIVEMVDMDQCYVHGKTTVISFNDGSKYSLSCVSYTGLYHHEIKLDTMFKAMGTKNQIKIEADRLRECIDDKKNYEVIILKNLLKSISLYKEGSGT
jgi:hypothetical protein